MDTLTQLYLQDKTYGDDGQRELLGIFDNAELAATAGQAAVNCHSEGVITYELVPLIVNGVPEWLAELVDGTIAIEED